MVKGSKLGKMEKNMKENINMIKNMGLVNLLGPMSKVINKAIISL